MIVAAILVFATIVLFITEVFPLSISGIFGMLLLIGTGILTFTEAFSAISGSIVAICFGMMVVGSAMFKSGLVDTIGRFAIKLSKGNDKALIWVLTWLCFFLAAFLSNTTVVVLGFTLAAGVVKASPTMKMRNIAMPMAFATCFGGQCTLIGTTSNLAASGILEKMTGSPLGMWTQTSVGLAVGIPVCLLLCFLAVPLGNRIWGDRPEASFIVKEAEPAKDKKKLWAMAIIMIGLIICWVFNILTVANGALLGACLVIMLGIVDIKTAFSDVDWNICIWLGIILALPTAITNSGISDWLALPVLRIVDFGGQPWLSVAFVIFFTWILTHIISTPPVWASCCRSRSASARPPASAPCPTPSASPSSVRWPSRPRWAPASWPTSPWPDTVSGTSFASAGPLPSRR